MKPNKINHKEIKNNIHTYQLVFYVTKASLYVLIKGNLSYLRLNKYHSLHSNYSKLLYKFKHKRNKNNGDLRLYFDTTVYLLLKVRTKLLKINLYLHIIVKNKDKS